MITMTLMLIGLAYSMYVKNGKVPVPEGQALSSVHNTVYNKYFIDEIYDAIVVKPLFWLSKMLDSLIENFAIDRIVNSFGTVVIGGSKVLRLLQAGSIGFYIFIMVVGIVLMLSLAVFR